MPLPGKSWNQGLLAKGVRNYSNFAIYNKVVSIKL